MDASNRPHWSESRERWQSKMGERYDGHYLIASPIVEHLTLSPSRFPIIKGDVQLLIWFLSFLDDRLQQHNSILPPPTPPLGIYIYEDVGKTIGLFPMYCSTSHFTRDGHQQRPRRNSTTDSPCRSKSIPASFIRDQSLNCWWSIEDLWTVDGKLETSC